MSFVYSVETFIEFRLLSMSLRAYYLLQDCIRSFLGTTAPACQPADAVHSAEWKTAFPASFVVMCAIATFVIPARNKFFKNWCRRPYNFVFALVCYDEEGWAKGETLIDRFVYSFRVCVLKPPQP